MDQLIHAITAFAKAHAMLTYGMVALLAASEALPVIGMVMPGTTGIVAIAALIPSGAVSFFPVLVGTMIGGFAGDEFSYWLGRRYKGQLVHIWPLRRRPELIGRGQTFFDRHGGKSVLIARFTPAARAVVPLAAGVSEMPALRFAAMNFLSVVLWAPLHIGEGFLLGAGVALLGAIAGRLAALVGGFLVSLALVVWATVWLSRFVTRLAPMAHRFLWTWASSGNEWGKRQIRLFLDPTEVQARAIVVVSITLVGSLWLFGGVLQDVVAGDPLVRADQTLFEFLQLFRTAWANHIAIIFSGLGSGAVLAAVVGGSGLWVGFHGRWRALVYLVAAVGGAGVLSVVVHAMVEDVGPSQLSNAPAWVGLLGWHAAMGAALVVSMEILIAGNARVRLRMGFLICAVSLIFLINLARLYLGITSLSTVLLGLALGSAWSSLLALLFLSRPDAAVPARATVLATSIVFVLAGSMQTSLAYPAEFHVYPLRVPIHWITLTRWSAGGWATIPGRRLDLTGEYGQPLNVQWAGPLRVLKAKLSAHGWHAPPAWNLNGIVGWLAPHTDLADLPVLPKLASGRPQSLTMVYSRAPAVPSRSRIVLRIWRSTYQIRTSNHMHWPLWVGTVEEQRPAAVFPFLTVASRRKHLTVPVRLLADSLSGSALVQRAKKPKARSRRDVVLGQAMAPEVVQ